MIAFILCLLVTAVGTYKTGAPETACPYPNIVPQHNGQQPQTGPSPFSLTATSFAYTPESIICVIIRGNGGADFKGFAVAAVENGERIGTWTGFKDRMKQLQNCSLATHTDNTPKKFMKFAWKAPNKSGEVKFNGIVVEEYSKFWTNIDATKETNSGIKCDFFKF